jgi:NitT/TauT family transport system ATP-binding protein
MRTERKPDDVSRRATRAQPHVGAASAPVLIEYRDVEMKFQSRDGNFLAVKDVTLDIARGEILTVVGPSGCGKSTLLNMTAGLIAPTQGEVLYDGAKLAGINQKVGYMTQSDHLLPWRTVFGNIAAPLEIRRTPKSQIEAKVSELLEMVGLSDFRDSYPNQISGGMRKRCALSRLLAYDPETLLMDEPFGALDAQLRLRLQIQLRHLCKSLGKTVIFITHDLEEAVAIGDRCAVFSASPGTVLDTFTVALPADRDLMRIRYDAAFREMCATLWTYLEPSVANFEGTKK